MKFILALVFLVVSLLCRTASATVTVWTTYAPQSTGGSCFSLSGLHASVGSGVAVSIPALTTNPPGGTACGQTYHLTAVHIGTSNGTDAIGAITITNGSQATSQYTVFIPSSLGGSQYANPGSDWAGITTAANAPAALQLLTTATMDISGPVKVDLLVNLKTGGAILASGYVTANTADIGCEIKASSIAKCTVSGISYSINITNASSGQIHTTTGNIGGGIYIGNASITSNGFKINSAGSIEGDIVVPAGEIREITAVSDIVSPAEFSTGSWDSPSAPADAVAWPTRLKISVADRIRLIQAVRIAAHIDADSDNTGDGQLDRLVVTGTSGSAGLYGTVNARLFSNAVLSSQASIDVAGVQKSVITMPSTATGVQSPIEVGTSAANVTLGPVSAGLTTTGDVQSGVTWQIKSVSTSGQVGKLTVNGTMAGLVLIDGSMPGDMIFGGSGNPGLSGQVIVNAANGSNTWTGTAKVGGSSGTSLATIPYYSNTALGGGAVGQSQFHLHDADCLPANNGSGGPPPTTTNLLRAWQVTQPTWRTAYTGIYAYTSLYNDTGFRIRFYGPVKRTGTTGANDRGVSVQRYNAGTSAWEEATDDFTITIPTSDSLVRDVIVEPIFSSGDICPGVYRVIRNSDQVSPLPSRSTRLVCAYVSSNPEVASFTYYFEISKQQNPGDVGVQGGNPGSDGVLDNNDYTMFINYFFALNTLADVGIQGGGPGQDGLFNNNDFVMMNNFIFEPQYTLGSCSIDDPSGVPFELPEALVTGDHETDRQLNALWIFLDRTGDQRVAARLVDTLFTGAD